jgi:hypothetical protein
VRDGEFHIFRAPIGALIIALGLNGLNSLGAPTFSQYRSQGAILIVAVGLSSLVAGAPRLPRPQAVNLVPPGRLRNIAVPFARPLPWRPRLRIAARAPSAVFDANRRRGTSQYDRETSVSC